jgi:hypothetical protein
MILLPRSPSRELVSGRLDVIQRARLRGAASNGGQPFRCPLLLTSSPGAVQSSWASFQLRASDDAPFWAEPSSNLNRFLIESATLARHLRNYWPLPAWAKRPRAAR